MTEPHIRSTWYRVRVSDPSTVGRRRFPPLRGFRVLREAERYAVIANSFGLGAVIEPPIAA